MNNLKRVSNPNDKKYASYYSRITYRFHVQNYCQLLLQAAYIPLLHVVELNHFYSLLSLLYITLLQLQDSKTTVLESYKLHQIYSAFCLRHYSEFLLILSIFCFFKKNLSKIITYSSGRQKSFIWNIEYSSKQKNKNSLHIKVCALIACSPRL